MTFEKKEIPLEQPKIRRYNYHCVSNLINVKHRIRAVSPFQPDNKKHSHFKSPLLQFHIHFICLFSLVSTSSAQKHAGQVNWKLKIVFEFLLFGRLHGKSTVNPVFCPVHAGIGSVTILGFLTVIEYLQKHRYPNQTDTTVMAQNCRFEL